MVTNKTFIIFLLFSSAVICCGFAFGQVNSEFKVNQTSKPVLDTAALNRWPGFGEHLSVSSDGKYFCYATTRGRSFYSMVVQGTDNSWKKEFVDGGYGYFSSDSKQYIFENKDGLCFVRLGKEDMRYEKGATGCKSERPAGPSWLAWKTGNSVVVRNLVKGKEQRYNDVLSYGFDKSGRWFVCEFKNAVKEMLTNDLATGREHRFSYVTGYKYSDDGGVLALQTVGEDGLPHLSWIELKAAQPKVIWSSKRKDQKPGSVQFDAGSSQLLFTVPEGKSSNYTVWHYSAGQPAAIEKVNSQTAGRDDFLVSGCSFSKNGKHILIDLLEPADERKPDTKNKAKVDIWSYTDTLIQGRQLFGGFGYSPNKRASYRAVLMPTGKLLRLQHRFERITATGPDYVVVSRDATGDRFWEPGFRQDSNFVVGFGDGIRHALPVKGRQNFYPSPDGSYLVWFDAERGGNYFSYELATCKITNLSGSLPTNSLAWTIDHDTDSRSKGDRGIAIWLSDGKGILVYDDYDLWRLDPSGVRAPMNLTNGYGRRSGIRLWLAEVNNGEMLAADEELLLTAFDKKSYYNGYYYHKIGREGDPERLFMGPYCLDYGGPQGIVQGLTKFGGPDNINESISASISRHPVKASGVSAWIVQRQSAMESPNYYLTKDFKQYKPLTNLQPQEDYNWLTAELVSFRQTDGMMSRGVLYKPENFNPTHKYPLIINYYISLSTMLYRYPQPAYMRTANVSISWFVSRGYLVFLPDIYGPNGTDKAACLRAVEGAAGELGRLSYVDTSRIGICGHSVGGAKTMYLVAHSNKFAAAFAGAAPNVDWVSHGLQGLIQRKPDVKEVSWEEGLSGMEEIFGGTLWDHPEKWAGNPVMRADKVTMPLLIYHGEWDNIPLSQPLEMFVALRRLKKPVWLLNYNKSHHATTQTIDAVDLTLRATQFFDHYLKGLPAPRWMTEGRPAQLKQIDDRWELDTISTPKSK